MISFDVSARPVVVTDSTIMEVNSEFAAPDSKRVTSRLYDAFLIFIPWSSFWVESSGSLTSSISSLRTAISANANFKISSTLTILLLILTIAANPSKAFFLTSASLSFCKIKRFWQSSINCSSLSSVIFEAEYLTDLAIADFTYTEPVTNPSFKMSSIYKGHTENSYPNDSATIAFKDSSGLVAYCKSKSANVSTSIWSASQLFMIISLIAFKYK